MTPTEQLAKAKEEHVRKTAYSSFQAWFHDTVIICNPNVIESITDKIAIAALTAQRDSLKRELAGKIDKEIADLRSEETSWRDNDCPSLAYSCKMRITTLEGVKELINTI